MACLGAGSSGNDCTVVAQETVLSFSIEFFHIPMFWIDRDATIDDATNKSM